MKFLANLYFFTLLITMSVKTFAQAEVDSELLTALQSSNTSVGAVVTFYGDGAPTQSQINLLSQTGITKG